MRKIQTVLKYPLYMRIFHALNACFCFFLLLSGFQIFNVHPRLYLGDVGYATMSPIFGLILQNSPEHHTFLQFFSYRFDVTGWWGEPVFTSFFGEIPRFYPTWMTLPWQLGNMGIARGLHFLFIFVFSLNLTIFLFLSIASGAFRKHIFPNFKNGFIKNVLGSLKHHILLKNFKEGIKPHHNPLQKLTYCIVLLLICPLLILTGIVMSPTGSAALPVLSVIFGGRQTARTIHFICANLLLLFVIVHIFQVLIVGFRQSLRVIVTGKLTIQPKFSHHDQ